MLPLEESSLGDPAERSEHLVQQATCYCNMFRKYISFYATAFTRPGTQLNTCQDEPMKFVLMDDIIAGK